MREFNTLPKHMKTDVVYAYYSVLKKKRIQLVAKNVIDKLLAVILLIFLLPVVIVLSIWIKCDSPGPVFYRQERVTQYGRMFKIFKFRTMVVNADKIGSLVTVGEDQRITRVGKFIRKYRLDEVPQLLNVLIGDMSFVGVRPEVNKYVTEYTEEMYATLLLPAGITSLASIRYKNEDEELQRYVEQGMSIDEAYCSKVLPDKMQYNLEYIKNVSLMHDATIMLQTIVEIIR